MAHAKFTNEPYMNFSTPASRKRQQEAIARVRAGLGAEYPIVIGAERVTAAEKFNSYNPSRPSEVLGVFQKGTAELAHRAMDAAGKAFETWQDVPPKKRAEYLFRAARLMRKRRAELNAVEMLEVGKSWAEADADVAEAIDFLEFYGREIRPCAHRRGGAQLVPGGALPGQPAPHSAVPPGRARPARARSAQVLERLAAVGRIAPVTHPDPPRAGSFGVYLQGRWYLLELDPASIPADPIRSLDAALLEERVLGPVLGIGDVLTDPRIDFVGGIRGTPELERRVNSGEMAIAFAMYPVSLDQLMAVSDAGAIMPPKTTWFEPKLRSGLFVHLLD